MAGKINLSKLKLPDDLKKLNKQELDQVCSEVRKLIIKTASTNGGHLSSNLGVVEATVAMHIAFNLKKDRLVFDVGHQSYAHKIITGRLNKINTIRTSGGISGFPKREESKYDAFDTGHSSTSISAAFGLAKAGAMQKSDAKYIAFIGDGALTGGLAFEALNNAGRFKRNFIVILNDNKMSISGNVGALSRYLGKIRTNPNYLKTKENMEKILNITPIVGSRAIKALKHSKSAIKNMLYKGNIFEDMGFTYFGPVDGHNIEEMVKVFNIVKQIDAPILVHIITKKGKGYEFAEKYSAQFHGVSKFDVKTGQSTSSDNFSSVFGNTLAELAQEDKKICAITAAMKSGTGLLEFSKKFKGRCFDVGIAEEHAATFAGALAVGGVTPVFAVYSTFLQRCYDQILHDIALQKAHVVLAIDRAGIVGEDGETHQGIFDVALLNTIPNAKVFSPAFFEEIKPMFKKALYDCKGLAAVRYPRSGEIYKPSDYKYTGKTFDIYGNNKNNITIVTYGRLFSCAVLAKEQLSKKNISVNILKLNQICPIDKKAIEYLLKSRFVFCFEEGVKYGGCGQIIGAKLLENNFKGKFSLSAIENKFVRAATSKELLQELELDDKAMVEKISKTIT